MWLSSISTFVPDAFEPNTFNSADVAIVDMAFAFSNASNIQVGQVQTETSSPEFWGDRPDQTTLSRDTLFASLGALLLFSLYLIIRCNLQYRKAVNSNSFNSPLTTERATRRSPNQHSEPPCMSCHFFTHNMYLPCAVNPSTALKAEAKDCPDFRSDVQTSCQTNRQSEF